MISGMAAISAIGVAPGTIIRSVRFARTTWLFGRPGRCDAHLVSGAGVLGVVGRLELTRTASDAVSVARYVVTCYTMVHRDRPFSEVGIHIVVVVRGNVRSGIADPASAAPIMIVDPMVAPVHVTVQP